MKQPINEIKRMQRIAGIITESEYRESSLPKGSSFSSQKLVDTLKQYIESNALGLKDIDFDPKYVHFEFWEDEEEANKFEEFLLASMLPFKRSKERDGGNLVHMFDVDKKQVKQQLGIE